MKKKLRSMYHETTPFQPRFPIKEFNIHYLSRNTGVNFEIRIAELLFVLGWRNIMTTARTGDWGADLLATDPDGVRWVIQCKRYSGTVKPDAVQQVYYALGEAYRYADKAVIITNSEFTMQAQEMARTARNGEIELISGNELSYLCELANHRLNAVNSRYCRRY